MHCSKENRDRHAGIALVISPVQVQITCVRVFSDVHVWMGLYGCVHLLARSSEGWSSRGDSTRVSVLLERLVMATSRALAVCSRCTKYHMTYHLKSGR